VLAAAAVLAQVSYPLLSGDALDVATVTAVVLFCAASVADAAARWGRRAAGTLVGVAGSLGLAAETAGVHTGVPFGPYAYGDRLGPALLGVPLVVPLAWVMMAYPCLLLGRRLAGAGFRRAGRPPDRAAHAALVAVLGGLALAAWDLYLDPQMVAAGHWTWLRPEPSLPGVPGIPVTNYAGWVLVSLLMIAALDRLLPGTAGVGEVRVDGAVSGAFGDLPGDRTQGHVRSEAVPAGLLAWTWAGSGVGNLVFFDRPWVALYGGVVMGVLVVPYLLAVLRRERE